MEGTIEANIVNVETKTSKKNTPYTVMQGFIIGVGVFQEFVPDELVEKALEANNTKVVLTYVPKCTQGKLVWTLAGIDN